MIQGPVLPVSNSIPTGGVIFPSTGMATGGGMGMSVGMGVGMGMGMGTPHWSRDLYQHSEKFVKSLSLMFLIVAPVCSVYNNEDLKISFLDSFSNQMQNFSSLVNTSKLFFDPQNLVINNFAAFISMLPGLARGVYTVVDVLHKSVVPPLRNADYSALFSNIVSCIKEIPIIYFFMGSTVLISYAINYWLNRTAENPVTPPPSMTTSMMTSTPMQPIIPKLPEPNIAEIIEKLPPGSSFKMTKPDGTTIRIKASK